MNGWGVWLVAAVAGVAVAGEAPVVSREAIEAALGTAPIPATEVKTRGLRIQARSEEARSDTRAGAIDLQVAFALNSAALLPEARAQLGELAGALNSPRLASQRFELGGHTDASGTPGRNRALSLDRARAVREYLEGAGVDATRLDVAGHGSDRPLAGSDAHDARNRRVEVRTAEKAR